MEGKKLNLNQPLLSVRKYSQTAASKTVDDTKIHSVIPRTPYRSELKSGPVGNPGGVPFQWEQIPGQPKEEIKRQIQNVKLPPKPKKYDSHQVSSRDMDNKIEAVDIDRDSLTGSFVDVKINDLLRSKEKIEENKDSSKKGRDKAYAEALESFLLHCGTNGSFSIDRKAREFSKDKFLTSEEQSPVEEEENSEDKCDQHVNLPEVCCLLPQFCLKSSICIFNPFPAVSMRTTRILTSPANRIQPRSLSSNEYKSHISELKPVEKCSKNDSNRLKSRDMSTHHEDKDVFALPEETRIEGFKTFQELLVDQCSPTELESGNSIVEKTGHVATIESVENLRNCPVDTQDAEINTKRTDQMRVKDSSHEDLKKIVSSIDKSRENLDYKQDSTTTKNIGVSEKQPLRTPENCHKKYSDFAALPPLRSPSDSWLRRTLPSHLASASNPRYEKPIFGGKLRLSLTRTKV